MAFDFVILVFTTIVLGRFSRPNEGLSGLLFRDGLIYFLVTSVCNTIPAVSRWVLVTKTMSSRVDPRC